MTRDYWKYFKDDLGYPQISRPGPLALLAEAEAGELGAQFAAGENLRRQFFPRLAEGEAVDLHGLGRGMARYRLESDRQYRLRVKDAFAWHLKSGRHWGMHDIFAEYGFPIISMIYLKDDHWAEFDIEVQSPDGTAIDDNIFELVYWLVFEYKRASAMLRTMRLIKRTAGKFIIKAALAVGERHVIYPPPPEPSIPPALVKTKMAALTHEHWTLMPKVVRYTVKKPQAAGLSFPLVNNG